MSGTAVVLFNLGGPDRREAIRPYLYNFFMDKNIIRAPLPLRWVAATLITLAKIARTRGAADASVEMLHRAVAIRRREERPLPMTKPVQEPRCVCLSKN